MINRAIDSLTAAAYFAAWRIVRWLPEKSAYRLFSSLADAIGRRNGKSVQRLRSNLQRVKPSLNKAELDALVLLGLRSYLRYWCDTFRFPDWSREKLMGTVDVTNEHLLMDAIRAGTGVIVALPHAGNWDHAGAYFCGKGVKIVTVAERLKPEVLFRKFLAYREAIGMEVLPLDGRVIATLAKRLRAGQLVALVADRDLSRTGITVNFFGGLARMPAGPAVLALNTEAPLITAYVSYTPGGIHIDFRETQIPITRSQSERVLSLVQQCADHFAQGIAAHPQDWHMLQRIWVDGDFTECTDA
ncbi:MAG: phosphatidylinositol mannoside acyltransferase [Actinomycetota bacterium]